MIKQYFLRLFKVDILLYWYIKCLKNELEYARARDEYYTTWEAINKGEGDLPEGSGGQTLSVNTFVIMMIMSFKKNILEMKAFYCINTR